MSTPRLVLGSQEWRQPRKETYSVCIYEQKHMQWYSVLTREIHVYHVVLEHISNMYSGIHVVKKNYCPFSLYHTTSKI